MIPGNVGHFNSYDDFDDWQPDSEIYVHCRECGSTDLEYCGEVYDDDEPVGSSYKCHDCGTFTTDRDNDE